MYLGMCGNKDNCWIILGMNRNTFDAGLKLDWSASLESQTTSAGCK